MTTRPVEQKHREAADEALCGAEVLFQGEYDEALDRVAQALANAEHPAPSSEGGFDPWEALTRWAASPARSVTIGYGAIEATEGGKQLGITRFVAYTETKAAFDLCHKLGLNSADQAKGDADG